MQKISIEDWTRHLPWIDRPDADIERYGSDLPDFFGPFRHWKVASDFAAMPQDFLNAAGVCCPKLECGRTSL